MLTVTGNGRDELGDLILNDARAVCLHDVHFDRWAARLYDVPDDGEVFTLTELGTHCKGAVFGNGEHLITPELTRRIDEISHHIKGFYFGRYDIRCPSDEEVMKGENLRVVELNGVTSVSTHIYEPGFPLWKAYVNQTRETRIRSGIGIMAILTLVTLGILMLTAPSERTSRRDVIEDRGVNPQEVSLPATLK